MPKKVLTVEEKKLQRMKEVFKKTDRINTAMRDDHITLRNQLDVFERDTNLGYYREYGPTGDREINDYNKLKFEENYKYDLLDKYNEYQENFEKLEDAYKKVTRLQREKIEREAALEAQKELIEAAKKNGTNLELEDISLDVKGLNQAKKEFSALINKVNKMSNEISALADEKNYEKQLDNHLKEIGAKNQKDKEVKEAKEDPAKKEQEAKEKARKERSNSIDGLKVSAKSIYISEMDQNKINDYYKEYVTDDILKDSKKYSCFGNEKGLTFNEAFEAYKDASFKEYKTNLEKEQNKIKDEFSKVADTAFKRGTDAVDVCLSDYNGIKERANCFEDLDTHVTRDVRFDEDKHLNPEKYAEMIGITNKLSQIHNQSKKPGFFSRVFRTDYYKAYSKEEGIINNYKNLLKEDAKIDSKFIDKITSKETCNNPIDKNEMMNCFYGALKEFNSTSILFKQDADAKKAIENTAKINAISDVFNKKSPIDSIDNYFKKANEKVAEEQKEKEITDPIKSNDKELNNDRVKIEISELAPEKQGLSKENIPEKSNEIELQKENVASNK